MTMRLRPRVHAVPLSDGVYFGGARRQFMMRGSAVLAQVAAVCLPLLRKGATEDELVLALGSERSRAAVRYLIGGLRTHGMLLDMDRLTVPEPSDEVRRGNPDALAHLESVCDDPYAVFARLRATAVLLIGDPHVVGPAARGLTRAGVGRVRQARSVDKIVEDMDAILVCCAHHNRDDALQTVRAVGRLPRSTLVVTVLLDDRLLLAGPILRDRDEDQLWRAFTQRTLFWAQAEGIGSPSRPVADAVAGALAGRLLFETLAGVAVEGEAHVLHGAELTAERVVVDFTAVPDGAWRSIDDAEAVPLPTGEDMVALADSVTRRWTGLFTSVADDDLPQMPLALRETRGRADRAGSAVVWGADQESAAVGSVLEALRRSCSGPGTGAAGLTEEHWLLDGVLRLLAEEALPEAMVTADQLDAGALRIWQSLQRQGGEPPIVQVLHIPGVDWRLARVEAAVGGEVLALAWGEKATAAVREAIGTAFARTQVPVSTAEGHGVAVLRTDALLYADEESRSALRRQVTTRAAETGVRYRGRPERMDALLGEIALWFGPVTASPLTPRPAHPGDEA
ncbi:hypothetical protein ABZ250_43045 [Streptomyces afghaniensis]|uniref:hypothetical protein n=1 Tax=Streptomyces afghaniensis TaxID=66865 RepID=UPI0033BEFB09